MGPDRSAVSLGENPYVIFISFLYAWVAANIADLFSELSSGWARLHEKRQKQWHVPLWSHLTLAAFVVGTSWLGWTGAFIRNEIPLPKQVLAPSSLLLIVDFWILGTYFAYVDVVYKARLNPEDDTDVPSISAEPAYWLMLILVGYVLWDILAYFVLPRLTSVSSESHFWRNSWMSILCMGLALALLYALRRVRVSGPFWVLGADSSALALILFYRALKQGASWSQSVEEQIMKLICHPMGSWLNIFTLICLFYLFLSVVSRFFAWSLTRSKTKSNK